MTGQDAQELFKGAAAVEEDWELERSGQLELGFEHRTLTGPVGVLDLEVEADFADGDGLRALEDLLERRGVESLRGAPGVKANGRENTGSPGHVTDLRPGGVVVRGGDDTGDAARTRSGEHLVEMVDEG